MKLPSVRILCLVLSLLTGVARASVDSTPPALLNVSFAPGAVDVSSSAQTISINVHASDVGSGIDSIYGTFSSPSGKHSLSFSMATDSLVSGNPLNGVYSSTLETLTNCDEPGTWTLESITVLDNCGNSTSYRSSTGGGYVAFPSGTQIALTVTNTSYSVSAPQLLSFFIAPASVTVTNSNQVVTVTAELSDTAAGIGGGNFVFISPSGDQSRGGSFDQNNKISGTQFDGIYQTTIPFNSCDEPGNWTLQYVLVNDPCENSVRYGSSGIAFPQGAQTQIAITNPNVNSTLPKLVSFVLSSTEADVTYGDVAIAGSAVVTDTSGGVSYGFGYYQAADGKHEISLSFGNLVGGTALDGTFALVGVASACDPQGVYTLKEFDVDGGCGTVAQYGGSGGAPFPAGVPTSFLVSNGTISTGSVAVAIYPGAIQYDGFTWNVDGGNSEFSNSVVSGLSPGPHLINFLPLNGFTTPATHSVTVVANQTTYTSGTYVAQFATDAVQVNLQPSGVGGMWTLDNGPLQADGVTISGLSDGSHTIQFSNVSGYTAPPGQVVTTASNLTTVTTGTYALITQFGSLTVNLTPSGAIHNGAQWTVDGGAAQSNGSTVAGLAVGAHSVNFTAATGYDSPLSQTVQINNNAVTSTTGTYTPSLSSTGALTVTILPAAAVKAGATWNVDSGPPKASGATVTGISGGNHTVNFSMLNAYVTPASRVISITPNGTVTTTGTYTTAPGFSGVAESFLGISASGNAILTMAMANTGKFTGKFAIDGGVSLTLSGSLSITGSFSGTAGTPPVPYTLQVTGSSPGTYQLTGSAAGTQIIGYPYAYAKGQTVAELGKYNTLLIPATVGTPGGTGYATITVGKTGVASITGKLADGTGFTASNALVANGTTGNMVIIYDTSIYAKKGLLSGMLPIAAGTHHITGSLYWIKPATKTAYYALGFNASLLVDGEPYVSGAIPFTTGSLNLSGGSLGGGITEPFSVSGSKVTITGTSNPDKVTLKITPATGAISGAFTPPGAKAPVKYYGLLELTPGTPHASGYFLGPIVNGTGLSGQVALP